MKVPFATWPHRDVGRAWMLHAVIATALYWMVATASLALAVPGAIISPLWVPAALALVLTMRWGRAVLPAFWAGGGLAFLGRGWPPLPAVVAGAAVALAAWSAFAMVERLQQREGDFIYNGNVFRFVLIALISGVVSAPVAVGAAGLADRLGPNPLLGWLTWTLGTAAGTVIFTPPLRAWRVWSTGGGTRRAWLEAAAFVVLLIGVSYFAFFGTLATLPFSYVPLPFMIWAAYRFHVPAIAWSTALVCLMAVWGTLRGGGPFAHEDLNTALLLLVLYVSVLGIMALALSSLLHQRAAAERKLTDERDQLEQRIQSRTADLRAELDERSRIEQQLAEAQRVAQIGSWNWELGTNEMVWSKQMYRIYKLDAGAKPIDPDAYLAMAVPEDRARVAGALEQALHDGNSMALEHRIQLADGSTRIIAAKVQGARDASGRVVRLFGTCQDVTEARQAEAALHEAQERYRLVVETSPDAIAVQQEQVIVFANPALLQLLRAERPERVVGRPLNAFIHPDYLAQAQERLTMLMGGQRQAGAEYKVLRLDGTLVDVEVSSSPFSHQGRFAVLHMARDITERKRSAEQLSRMAHFDALTGLPNRVLFQQRLQHALSIAARPGRSLELLFLDLDKFKQINDTLGHATGDVVLKETARRLQSTLRESDTVARLAGDEFVVLVENVDEPERGGTIAEKILAAFAPPFLPGPPPLHVGTSIGITTYPDDGTDADTLLTRADHAMYRAKQQGRNRYSYYSRQLDAQSMEQRTLEQALRQAVERGELVLHYQPVVDIGSRRIIGLEALLRWKHPGLGDIAPQRLIPLAEESGLMNTIGYWTLLQVCRQLRAWHDDGAGELQVAINLSPRQLADPGLVAQLEKALGATGLAPEHLGFEITDDAIDLAPVEAQRTLNALHAIGVGLTFDHFGAGPSPLAHLTDFPFGVVKMDRSFVQGIPRERRNAAVARAIIDLAHNLGCKVVAQGAETQQQVDFLRTHACDGVQGYYFGAAMPAESLAAMMARAPGAPH